MSDNKPKHDIKVAYKDVSDLIPYANNSRTHTDEQISKIAASIKEFGFNNPILIDSENGIIAGHGRLEAAKKMKLDKVPTVELSHLSPAERKAYIIADNRLAEIGVDWNKDLLSIELEELKSLDFDIELTGFDDSFLPEPENKGLCDENAVPDEVEPICKIGDIWKMGEHRLICGDSTSPEHFKQLMNGYKADQMVTDPPYNVDYEGKTKDKLKIQNDKMNNDDFRSFLTTFAFNAFENMKPGASFYIWHADSEGYNFRGAIFDCGEKVRQCLIWNKNSMVMGRQDFHWKHEPCLYGWKKGGSHLWKNNRKQTTILEFDRPRTSELHPTMKPVELIEYCIKNNTEQSNIVLDPFLGSGTTLIACEKTNRKCYGMEIDPHYCDVIIKRWEDYTGNKAEIINEGKGGYCEK